MTSLRAILTAVQEAAQSGQGYCKLCQDESTGNGGHEPGCPVALIATALADSPEQRVVDAAKAYRAAADAWHIDNWNNAELCAAHDRAYDALFAAVDALDT